MLTSNQSDKLDVRYLHVFVCMYVCTYLVLEVRADYEFEHGRPAGALNVPAFFSTAQGMTVNPDFVDQARHID